MADVSRLFSDFKIKASYGTNGNLPSGYYSYKGLYSANGGYGTGAAIYWSNPENDALGWEKSRNFNVGFDWNMYNRIDLSVEYYNKYTSSLIFDMPASAVTGFSSYTSNVGNLLNEGVEIELGAQLINVDGEAFMNPLETRDVCASSVIRECARGNGVQTEQGQGIWLDTPMIEMIHGEGTIEKRIPAMLRMYLNYGIDMRKVPILVYPTLHYQNGGLEIGGEGYTKAIPNLLVAGEAVGGIHGRNRLMGNSLLDIIVFGRNAGKAAARRAAETELGEMNLDHIKAYAAELEAAGVAQEGVSPLLLPNYARHER